MSAPHIISSETLVPASVGAGGASAAMELGRRLLAAARSGDTCAVRSLLARGAPLAADWLGTSPLHLAASLAHADTARVLLRAGVSRDARTKTERTPLHVAAAGGHAAVARALLEAGAAVDPRDMLRMTPLHWAVQREHAALAGLLVRHGADPGALSKFLKTPLAMAQAQPAVLRAIEDALRDRDTARSVSALVHEEMSEGTPESAGFEPVHVQRAHDIKPIKIKPIQQDKKSPKTDSKTERLSGAGAGGGGGGAGGGGAAQLLRAHGITLLPADDGSTVLSALQSGRTVVLSDAGKLMLKESSTPPAGGGGRGVVVTATPATSPPAPGVKVFTVTQHGHAPPAPHPARRPARRNLQQVKFVHLPPGAKLVSPSKAAAVRARLAPPAPPPPAPEPAAGGGGGTGAGAGPNVKIIMNRANFQKLIATATSAHQPPEGAHATVRVSLGGEGEGQGAGEEGEAEEGEGEESVVVVPEQFVRSGSAHYLRSQLLCAHAALHELGARLRVARARLKRLEAGSAERAPRTRP